ncbi:MAG: SRPBCC family protein [Solimonas sp.]
MLKIILIVIALVAVGIIAYAATRPDVFRVERRIVIAAPPEQIYPLIEDFHRWPTWSPYEKKDPAMKRDFSGAATGQGAVYAWDGDRNIGSGRMEITGVSAPNKIVIQLDFFKPFKASNVAEFSIVPRDGGSEVSWAMYGPAPFMSKLMGLFFDMDKMVGTDFEAGLASLKAAAEH